MGLRWVFLHRHVQGKRLDYNLLASTKFGSDSALYKESDFLVEIETFTKPKCAVLDLHEGADRSNGGRSLACVLAAGHKEERHKTARAEQEDYSREHCDLAESPVVRPLGPARDRWLGRPWRGSKSSHFTQTVSPERAVPWRVSPFTSMNQAHWAGVPTKRVSLVTMSATVIFSTVSPLVLFATDRIVVTHQAVDCPVADGDE